MASGGTSNIYRPTKSSQDLLPSRVLKIVENLSTDGARSICPETRRESSQHSPRPHSWWGGGCCPSPRTPPALSALYNIYRPTKSLINSSAVRFCILEEFWYMLNCLPNISLQASILRPHAPAGAKNEVDGEASILWEIHRPQKLGTAWLPTL